MSTQELINSLITEDAQPSSELIKLEQEIDNLDPSELPHIGRVARLIVQSVLGSLVFHLKFDAATSGSGQGPPEGKGSFYGTPVPTLWPNSANQVYKLEIQKGVAVLVLKKDHQIVFIGRYTGVQKDLDGVWRGDWNQGLLHH